jgi:hypothetical protein
MTAAVLVHIRDQARIPQILASLGGIQGVRKVSIKELSSIT